MDRAEGKATPCVVFGVTCIAFLLGTASCSKDSSSIGLSGRPPNPGLVTDPHSQEQWATARWTAKTARLLRGGEGLRPNENVAFLAHATQQQAIDYFMRDARFSDTVLDFSMYFLGFKRTRLRTDSGTFTDEV